MSKKIDNKSLASKVALRRWLLDKMQITEAYVLDACTGQGLIWTAMEEHVTIRQWVRCDIMPKPGKGSARGSVLKLSAKSAMKSMDLTLFNVVDIDPYSEPWGDYFEFLRRMTTPTAVFLTYGRTRDGLTHDTQAILGIPLDWDQPKQPIPLITPAYVAERCLQMTWQYAQIDYSAKIDFSSYGPSGVSYFALGLSPLPPPPLIPLVATGERAINLEG